MIAHCRRDWPREACGLLSGSRSIIEHAHPLPNIAPRPESCYLADPAALLATHRAIREAGRDILAIYHSHPRSTPDPSRSDLRENHWGGMPRVIVSLRDFTNPDVRAWWLGPNCFQGIPWSLLPDHAP
jgi:proteasome lid subunit RPN8/RPN11